MFRRKTKVPDVSKIGESLPVQMRILRAHTAAQASELGNIRLALEEIRDQLRGKEER